MGKTVSGPPIPGGRQATEIENACGGREMAIYLVQHGKSLPKEVDTDKGLSEEGKREVEDVASAAGKIGVKPSAIRHSGKKRAMQTADIFEAFLKSRDGIFEASGIGPLDDVPSFAATIDPKENLMIVGHLPFMEKLISHLIAGSVEKPVLKFQNGGVVCLEKDPGSRGWVIKCMLTPDIFKSR
jgi:phosphohistidine phosphatase